MAEVENVVEGVVVNIGEAKNKKASKIKTNKGAKGKVKTQSETKEEVVNEKVADAVNAEEKSVVDIPEEEWDKGQRDGIIDESEENTDNGDDSKSEGEEEMSEELKPEIIPFSRQTKIEKSANNVTIKSLFKEWKKDEIARNEGRPEDTTLRFDLAIQRNEVWTEQQRSDLIHSILYGFYIPPVLVKDTNDGKKWFLDGQQRTTTIMRFLNGEFALHKSTTDVYGHKIAGMKFKDLPEDMQETIQDETIQIVRIKNMTDTERDMMFVKLNSGSPLSRIELTRAKHSELIEGINDLSELKFFKEDLELSRKARVRFVDQEIILQTAMLFEAGKENLKGFSANHIESYVLNLKESGNVLSKEIVDKITKISEYLTEAFEEFEMDEIKKSLKKIHVPIVFWNADIAMKKGVEANLFGEFVRSFLITNYSVNSKYGRSCQSGSSKRESVITRIDEMAEALEDFIGIVNKSSDVKQGVEMFDEHFSKVVREQEEEVIQQGEGQTV